MAMMAAMVAGCASGDSGDAGDAGAPASSVSVIDSDGPTATTSMVTSAASDLPVVEASVDDASVAGLRIDQQPATVDDALAALQSLAGAPTADSGWQPIPAGQSCHLYAESRTIWWGDLRLSFARGHLEAPADDLSEALVAWAVGVVQAPSIVPPLGTPGAAVVDVRLDGAISVGATQEALEALVADKGYFFIQPGVVSAGGRPLFLGLGEGVLTGFAAGLDECYDDPSGM
jgi:hypothetical protein